MNEKKIEEKAEFLGLMSEGCFTCKWCVRPVLPVENADAFTCNLRLGGEENVVGREIIKLGYKPEWCPGFERGQVIK